MLSLEIHLGVSVLKPFGCRQLAGQPQGTFHTGKCPTSTVVIEQLHHEVPKITRSKATCSQAARAAAVKLGGEVG